MAKHSDRPSRPVRWVVAHSLWHWDFWFALAVGACVGTIFLNVEFDPERGWIMPLFLLSCGVLTASLQQWASLRSKLRGSPYGELVRIADQSEIEVRMPYQVTVWVAVASVVCAVLAMVFIEAVDRYWAQAAILTATGLFSSWSLLALVSLIGLLFKHDRNIAEIESLQEKTAAAQRRTTAEQDSRTDPSRDHDDREIREIAGRQVH